MFERIMKCICAGRTKDKTGDVAVFEHDGDKLVVTSYSPARGVELVVLVFNDEVVASLYLMNYFDLNVYTELRYRELDTLLQTLGEDISSVHLKNVSYRTLNKKRNRT